MNTFLADKPALIEDDDFLSIMDQVKGFAKFIATCETPLTVSIQGKWGSGKTSFFNLVKKQLEKKPEDKEKYQFVTFNAWQYSQFNAEGELPESLLTSLVNQIKGCNPQNAILEEQAEAAVQNIKGLKKVGTAASVLLNRLVKHYTDIDFIKTIEEVNKELEKNNKMISKIPAKQAAPEPEADFVEVISKIQDDFRNCVNSCLDSFGPDSRLIIFIDDLDRLLPERAINVLDVMKVFLDTNRCVFILAIDYEVVINGVKLKYNGTISEGKGKEYFEKMIQVVYQLPNAMSHMNQYIEKLLCHYNGDNEEDSKFKIHPALSYDFSALLRSSGKDNPRSVKRIINNFFLVRTIAIESGKHKNETDLDMYLFSLICLQEVYPDIFRKCMSLSSPAQSAKELYRILGGRDDLQQNEKDFISSNFGECIKSTLNYLWGKEEIKKIKTVISLLNSSYDKKLSVAQVLVSIPKWILEEMNPGDNIDYPDAYKNCNFDTTEDSTAESAYRLAIKLILNYCPSETGIEELCKLHFLRTKRINDDDLEIRTNQGCIFAAKEKSDEAYLKDLKAIADEFGFSFTLYQNFFAKSMKPAWVYPDADDDEIMEHLGADKCDEIIERFNSEIFVVPDEFLGDDSEEDYDEYLNPDFDYDGE